ncbi:chemotaxis protein CheB [Ramlibacter aurantiacus]|uniref:chemotaxis protein CheB n=1 Tax=Ramlibacter aurantiacus TaxID=2801330 RepID=UPI00338E82B0
MNRTRQPGMPLGRFFDELTGQEAAVWTVFAKLLVGPGRESGCAGISPPLGAPQRHRNLNPRGLRRGGDGSNRYSFSRVATQRTQFSWRRARILRVEVHHDGTHGASRSTKRAPAFEAVPLTAPSPGLTIVALGASAGGLEALQGFFGSMPADSRLAFVVISHLAPHHDSMMAELLGRASTMPVTEAKDGEAVEPGRIYVIPPGCLMDIRGGSLRLGPAAPRPSILRSIDHFMCSLAADQQERSAGIVLSGADHDGTAGLKEIKAAGGLTLVQDPETAKFPSMPRAAIEAGVPDRVLPVQRMGQALIDYLTHAPTVTLPDESPALANPAPDDLPGMKARLQDILDLVQARTGHDFRWYRSAMLLRRLRRLRRRMGLNRVGDVSAYLDLLQQSDEELTALVKDFLISVTDFFREPQAWQVLEENVVPDLIRNAAADASIRVWTPGCATGEESYSIAMVLLEHLGARGRAGSVCVFASDLDSDALTIARAGVYPETICDKVSAARLARFFEKQGQGYAVNKLLRESVVFAPQNLVRDPPYSKLDLIACRNLLIYFEPAQQARILELFHFALKPGGVLFLGKSESLGTQAALFEPVSREHRIFRRTGLAARLPHGFPGKWSGPGGFLTPAKPPGRVIRGGAELTREHLGERQVTAAVLINRDGRALYFQGETGRYLQPAGEPTWDLLALAREGLRLRLRTGVRRAIAQGKAVGLEARVTRDDPFAATGLRIEPLADFDESGLLLVCYVEPGDPTAPAEGQASAAFEESQALRELEDELRSTRSELLTALQEEDNANAELRVAHEEAMSMNEELQSSNEELESSKEELQSLNEELSTVNSELEGKLAELQRALDDLRNLMDSTRVATLFLDQELRIRRFTQPAVQLFHLLASDQGRPLRDIASEVVDPGLLEQARGVLELGEPVELEVHTAKNDWFLRRIQPFRTGEGSVEGVVVTYVDITALRHAAQEARRLAAVLRDSNDAVIAHGFDGRILYWNRGAQRAYGHAGEEALALSMSSLVPASHREQIRTFEERVRQDGCAGPETTRRITRDGRTLDVSITASVLRDDAGNPDAVLSTERDITEQLRLASDARFRAMADDIPILLRIENEDGRTLYLNRAWLEFTGERHRDLLLAEGWLRYIHPDDLPTYVRGAQEARGKSRRFDVDVRLRRVDGSYQWMRSIEIARRGDDGQLMGYVSVTLDSEERKLAEQELAQASARKDEFLAMLAHELRNPLAPIRNAVAVIERSGSAEPRIRWATGIIDRQIQQLARLVDDLMDTARISSGKVVLTREPIDIAVLVERARDTSAPLVEARKQRLTIVLPPGALFVEGDLVRLTQVISNLLNNASKYTGDGGAIQLEVHASETQVVISVTDDGIGISPEMLPRVFDLFVQADRTLDRAQGGLGLGLTLVRSLVELHGGSVEARSAGHGLGSRFVVRLPLLHLPPTKPPVDEPGASVQADHSRRVLVIDDNVDNAESLAVILGLDGHEVRVAYAGEGALEMAAQFLPDVVVLDIGLPGMSGYEVARHLRGRRESAQVLLIALTGYGGPEDAVRVKAAGFDHHLVKPAVPAQLKALVAQHVRP